VKFLIGRPNAFKGLEDVPGASRSLISISLLSHWSCWTKNTSHDLLNWEHLVLRTFINPLNLSKITDFKFSER